MSGTKPTPFWKHVRLSFLNSSDRGADRLREASLLRAAEEEEDEEEDAALVAEGESVAASSTPSRTASSSSSIVESIRGCGLPGLRVGRGDLRRRVLIPDRLLAGMAEAVRSRNLCAAEVAAVEGEHGEEDPPEAPLVVFVNSRSGKRYGPLLKSRLQELIGEDQVRASSLTIFFFLLFVPSVLMVFDLSATKPSDFVQYGLAFLERLADLGDYCAKATRENLRVMVAGGDGTVGWVLESLGELYVQNREPVPPSGIIPLGTGNDLSRSFGWVWSYLLFFSFAYKIPKVVF
ncbi:hypothetical protein GW17_00003027 [Ensete ventricosum]|nr:hypothetical protein GW17_00003027 [Ensete ventricosum]RZR89839.1 hypothetical protein BHM03_00017633 [Ensete ventricosum]